MASSVRLNGSIFNRGDTVTFNRAAGDICGGPHGLKVYIHLVGDGSPIVVGIYSPDHRIGSWSDLDGEVGEHKGLWITVQQLEMCIEEGIREYEVGSPFEYKGVDLRGKSCRMLAGLDNGTVFVEFEEDVNGCSADGLGKTGHCVAVNSKILTAKKKMRKKHE